jgi:uncharacterized protein (TIGR03086 family)
MDLNTLYHRTVEHWADVVVAVGENQWDSPTPCSEWSVRDLVNHVTGEDLWTAALMDGSTIEEVGTRLDGDLLGDEPVGRSIDAAKAATTSVAARLPQGGTVPLSFGDTDVAEYVWQLAADHLIHSWDLSAATGTDRRLDPALVAGVAGWFAEREEIYRSSGAVAPRAISHGGAQGDLLATFGRDSEWGPNHACAARFLRAFGAGDVDACLVEMTPDCVFEATGPAPDGVRHEGADAVRAVWAQMFADTTDPAFTTEEQVVAGDRALFRWSYAWTNDDGTPGHVRGVDVVRFRDGRICEKLSYVKG